MNIFLAILIGIIVFGVCQKLLNRIEDNRSNRSGRRDIYNRKIEENKDYDSSRTKKKRKWKWLFSNPFQTVLPFDDEALEWTANFLGIDNDQLCYNLRELPSYYSYFQIRKRSGGSRTISAPNARLLDIQRTIYKRILISERVHSASTGFRQNMSVLYNAKPHLGNAQVLKIDIADFFGSIRKNRVITTFEKIGYPSNVSKVLAELCCHLGNLPQGAVTSPALSNIIAYNLDVKLATIAQKYYLTYTRYADDLTFSGENIPFDLVFSEIESAINEEKFKIQQKKTRFLTENRRKIITGISISSGEKLMIPKAKKREIRKIVYHIKTKGLAEHQKFIGSSDPSYLKRIIGYLNFWLMVEPNNEYVKRSLQTLRKLYYN